MEKPGIQKVVILGSGNLARHMGRWMSDSGIHIMQVFSRSPLQGEALAHELACDFTNRLDLLVEDADLYLLAVSDDAIAVLLRQALFSRRHLVVHSAGSIPLNVFTGRAKNYGVLYPLQTFTRERNLDYSNIPIFIEANNPANLHRIEHLANRLSPRVYKVDSEKRAYLHLAAVIASNFTNHMLALAEKFLQEKNLAFDLIKPLVQETIAKALSLTPVQAQTGPAVRGNREIIEKHMAMLDNHPEIKELYRVVSESIAAFRSDE